MLRLEQHKDGCHAEFDFEPFLDRDGVWLVKRWVMVDVWVGDSIATVTGVRLELPCCKQGLLQVLITWWC